jgi:hypothetical protein
MKTRKHSHQTSGRQPDSRGVSSAGQCASHPAQCAPAVHPAETGSSPDAASASPAEVAVEASCDLSSLWRVQLDRGHSAMLAAAKSSCGGSALWRHRKLAEARELLALAQLSRRLHVVHLDLSVDLRAALLMRVSVPCLREPNGPLEVGDTAHLGLIYREESLLLPQPGFSFIQILAPHPVWHPNVSPDPIQALCLGPRLVAGIPVRELILLTYGALTMMTVQLDPRNSAGVLNPAAADWYQRSPRWIPLSREPFLNTREVGS